MRASRRTTKTVDAARRPNTRSHYQKLLRPFILDIFFQPNVFKHVVAHLDQNSRAQLRLTCKHARFLMGESLAELRIWWQRDAISHLRIQFPGLQALHLGCCPIMADEEFPYCDARIMEDLSANIWMVAPYLPVPPPRTEASQFPYHHVAELHSLRSLDLQIVDFSAHSDFEPLSRLVALTDLSMHVTNVAAARLGEALATLPCLAQLNLTFEFDSTGLDLLYGPMDAVPEDESPRAVPVDITWLLRLTALRRLALKDDWGCSNIYWPSARALEHPSFHAALSSHPANRYEATIARLTHLESLDLARLELMAAWGVLDQLASLAPLTRLTGLSLAGDIQPNGPDILGRVRSALWDLRSLQHLAIEGRRNQHEAGGDEEERRGGEWLPILAGLSNLTQLTALKLIGERTDFLCFHDLYVVPVDRPPSQLTPLSLCADDPVWEADLLQAVDALLCNQQESLQKMQLPNLLDSHAASAPRTSPSAWQGVLRGREHRPARSAAVSPFFRANMHRLLQVWLGTNPFTNNFWGLDPVCISHMNICHVHMDQLAPLAACCNLRWLYVTFDNGSDVLRASKLSRFDLPPRIATLVLRNITPLNEAISLPRAFRNNFLRTLQGMTQLELLMVEGIQLGETGRRSTRPQLSLPLLRSLLLFGTHLCYAPFQSAICAPQLTALHMQELPALPPPRHRPWRLPPDLLHLSLDSWSLHCMGDLSPLRACRHLQALSIQSIRPVGLPSLVSAVLQLTSLRALYLAGCGCSVEMPRSCCPLAATPSAAPADQVDTDAWVLPALPPDSLPTGLPDRRTSGDPPPRCHAGLLGHAGRIACGVTWSRVLFNLLPHRSLRMLTFVGAELSYWPPYTSALPLQWEVPNDVDSIRDSELMAGLLSGAVTGMVASLQQDVNVMRTELQLHHLEIVIT